MGVCVIILLLKRRDKMRRDEATTMYMVRKIDEAMRRVTSYTEQYRVLREKGQEVDQHVDINTYEGIKYFADLKQNIVSTEKTPLKINEENEMYYYLSPDEKKGIVFTDEKDAQRLFLKVEETLENFKEEVLSEGKSK